MKNVIITTCILLLCSLSSQGQNLPKEKKLDSSYFAIAFGLNIIDNSNTSGLPADVGNFDFNRPFFISAEKVFNNKWSLAFNVSTNQLKLENDTAVEPYFGADVFANLFIDKLLFDNEKLDLYLGLGAGFHTIDRTTKSSLNATMGIRYWMTNQFALSFQTIAKFNKNGIPNVGNHYQLNLGIIYGFKQNKTKHVKQDISNDVAEQQKIAVAATQKKDPNTSRKNNLNASQSTITTKKNKVEKLNNNNNNDTIITKDNSNNKLIEPTNKEKNKTSTDTSTSLYDIENIKNNAAKALGANSLETVKDVPKPNAVVTKTTEAPITISETKTVIASTSQQTLNVKQQPKKHKPEEVITKNLDGKILDKGFYVIVYAFNKKQNAINVMRTLPLVYANAETIKDPIKTYIYISVARFDSKKEAYNYIKTTMSKTEYEGSWVYPIK